MMATTPEEILEALQRLSPEKQQRVLDYAQQLAQPLPQPHTPLPPGKPIEAFLAYKSSLPSDVVDEMARAIEEGCERVESDDDELFAFWQEGGP